MKENIKIINYKKNVALYLIMFIVSFAIACIFFTGNKLSGHDMLYHLQSIKSLDVAYNNGCFFSRIYELTCQDYGYGVGLFYSMIPSGIVVLIKNWFNISSSAAIGVEIFLILYISSILVYKFVFNLTKRKNISILSAICYILFPYIFADLFIRFSFTEIWYILLVPVIATSLYELIKNKNYIKFFIYFVIGFSLGIMIHLSITIYAAIFSFIYLMLNFKEFFNKKTLFIFSVACVFVLMISSTYYIPMLICNKDIVLSSMKRNLWKTSIAPILNFINNDFVNIYNFISLFSIITIYVIYLILFIKNRKSNSKNQKQFFIMSTILLFSFSPLNIFLFIINKTFLGLIQFIWRLYLFYAFFAVIQIVYILSNIKRNIFKEVFVILYIVYSFLSYIFFVIPFETQVNKNWESASNMLSTNFGTGSIKSTDYYPNGATTDYIFNRGEKMIIETNVEIDEFANYQSVKQINFETNSIIKDGYVVINIPYSECENIKIYQVEEYALIRNFELKYDKFEIDGDDYLLIKLEDSNTITKVTIDYSGSPKFDSYLKENPFEFIVTSGDEDAKFTNFVKENAHTYSVEIKVNEKTKIELPTLFYTGYSIVCENSNGTKIIEGYRNENGFLEIEIDEDCTIKVEYNPTFIKVSNVISIVGFVSFVLFSIWFYYYEKKKKIDTISN